MKSAAKGYKNCRTSWLLQKRTPETGEKGLGEFNVCAIVEGFFSA